MDCDDDNELGGDDDEVNGVDVDGTMMRSTTAVMMIVDLLVVVLS